MDDDERRVQILLIFAIMFGVCTAAIDMLKEELTTNKIEENLAYALKENIVASITHNKAIAGSMPVLDAHLSYVHANLKGNDAESERKKKDLDDKTNEFESEGTNYSDKYNRSLSNATGLINETEKLRDTRDLYNYAIFSLDALTFILLVYAVYLVTRQKHNMENLLVQIKNEHKEMKSSLKKLDDLLIEDAEEAWNNKGRTLYGLGKYNEAIQAYDKVIEINPRAADAWNSKGIIFRLLGRTTEANAAFAKAKELGLQPDPSFV